MFSKKEDFTNTIQYKIGIRFDDLHAESYKCVNDLAELFINKDQNAKWKSLNFLNFYYQSKDFLENLTHKKITADFNLNNELDKDSKLKFIDFIKQNNIQPIEFFRPNGLNNIIGWFPLFGILGPMLISTYLVTKLDMTGWWYLSGLVCVLVWLFIIQITKNLKNKFSPENFLDYIKSTYVIRHKTLSETTVDNNLVKQFIKDELKSFFQTEFVDDEEIPLN